jgi:hypothetical protein
MILYAYLCIERKRKHKMKREREKEARVRIDSYREQKKSNSSTKLNNISIHIKFEMIYAHSLNKREFFKHPYTI